MARNHEYRLSEELARLEHRREWYSYVARRAHGDRLLRCQRAIHAIDATIDGIQNELSEIRQRRHQATPWGMR